MITNEQFAEWKTDPVTLELFEELKKVRQELIDQLANGNTIGTTADATHGTTNRAIGQLDGINQLLNISFAGETAFDNSSEISGY